MDNPQALAPETRLAGEYRIKNVLGSGGFGITYLAEEETLKRMVAIKEYFPTGLAVREGSMLVRSKGKKGKDRYVWGLDRFIHEARILAKFNHDNIVRVYRYFRENNTAYMVLHHENGQSLKNWLDMLGRAPLQSELDALLEKILPALETIHDADLLHRDIAPDNILIREDGAPVLIDFGSARGDVAQHSKTVSAIVKPGYSPFEQYAVNAKQQGPWTDIYSLGATLYYAITRKRPLDAPGRVTDDNHKSAFETAKGRYRESFLRAIDRALEVKPERRPSHIGEWRDALIEPDGIAAAETGETVKIGSNPPMLQADKQLTYRPTRALTHGLGPTVAAATMPHVPDFLRFRRINKQRPGSAPPQSDTDRIPSAPNASDAAAAGSLANRLAEVRPSGDMAAQNLFAESKKSKDGLGFFGMHKAADGNGAAAITPEIDIPMTRIYRAATSAGSLLTHIMAAIVSPVYLLLKALLGGAARMAGNGGSKGMPVLNFFRTHAIMSFSIIAIMLTGAAVRQEWIPARYVNKAEAALGNFKRDWPVLKDNIEKSYASTIANVGKLRRALVSTPAVPVGNVQILRGHDGMVQTAIFTPDGKYIISGGIDERLRLWNLKSGRQDRILSKEQSSITALDIRDDMLLASGANGVISLKNRRTGKTIQKIRHHNGLVHSVAFGRKDTEFFSAGQDGAVKLWRNGERTPYLTLESGAGAVYAIAVIKSQNLVATAGADRVIKLWDVTRKKLIRKFRGHKRAVSSIHFSPDGRYLVSAGLDGRLKLWSAKSSRTRRTLRGHKGRIFMARFSPDGKLLASAGEDGTVRLWNVRRKRLLRTFKGHQGSVRTVGFSADGRKIVSGSDDGTIRVWTIRPSSRREIAAR